VLTRYRACQPGIGHYCIWLNDVSEGKSRCEFEYECECEFKYELKVKVKVKVKVSELKVKVKGKNGRLPFQVVKMY
jgi:hypothetical protein